MFTLRRPMFWLASFLCTFSISAFAAVDVGSVQDVLDYYRVSGFNGVAGVFDGHHDSVTAMGVDVTPNGRPLTGDDHFLIGSVTKQFTAAAIVKLAQDGQLKLSDPVSLYIPAFRYPNITIHHLLTHTSGIADVVATPEFDQLKMNQFVNLIPLISLIVTLPVDFPVGSKWEYSNSNYILLSQIIETVSGQTWWAYVKHELTDPAGLNETTYSTVKGPKLVSGHDFGRDYELIPIQAAAYLERGWASGAGGIESTAGDLAKWNQALYGGKLLTANSVALMTTPYAQISATLSYGYGLFINTDTVTGEKYFDHSGGIPGFASENAFFPSKNTSIVILSNCMSPDSAYLASSLRKIELRGHALLPVLSDDPNVTPFGLDGYVGSFASDSIPLAVNISLQNGHLYMKIEGQPEHRLLIHGIGKFYDRAQDVTVTFTPASFDEFQVDVSGESFHFKRKL